MTIVKLCVLVLLVAEVTGQQDPELKKLHSSPPVIEDPQDAVLLPEISLTFEAIEIQTEPPTFHHHGVPIPEIDVTVEPDNEKEASDLDDIQQGSDKDSTSDQKSNTNKSEDGGVQSGVKDKEKERETVKLYVTSVMYYICPVLLVCGATLQIFLILRFHRDHLGSYITMLYDSVMKLIFITMVLFVIYYKKRDRTICGIILCAEMTCIGCVCLSTCLATLYKLIMIKFPLTSYRWTSTRTQVKVCLVGTLIVFICSTWLGWDTFKLGTKMGFCNYKSDNYKNMMLGWIILIIGSTTVASVAMLIYIAFIVLKFRIEKVKRDGHQKSASTVKTETSFVVDTTVDTSGPIPVKPQPMVRIPEKSPPPKKAKFPTQIIVLILLTMGMALPWIPGFINPMWYYKRDRIVLDIVYSTMLLLIALSPFLTTLLRLSLRNDLIGLFKRGKK